MNLLAILDFMNGKTAQEIISAPRYHHQFMPDQVIYEAGAFTEEQIVALKQKGHVLKQSKKGYGNMQLIIWDARSNSVSAVSDPRGKVAGRVY